MATARVPISRPDTYARLPRSKRRQPCEQQPAHTSGRPLPRVETPGSLRSRVRNVLDPREGLDGLRGAQSRDRHQGDLLQFFRLNAFGERATGVRVDGAFRLRPDGEGKLDEPRGWPSDRASFETCLPERGVWSIIAALTISCLVLVALNWRRLGDRLVRVLDAGAGDSLKPIFNTASLVGFGAVMASLSGFILICDWVVTVGGDNPLISLAVATSLLAGMTGSASGGMSIALSTLGDVYLDMAQAAGIAPDLLHRVTAVATGGLDALPDNGAVITLLTICGLTHREAYRDIAVVALGIPIIALVILIVLGTLRATSSKKSARTGYPRRRRWCPRKRNVSARPSCQSMPLALARATPSIAGFGSRPAGPARSAAASTMPSWCRAASASGRAVALGQVPQSGARPRHRPNIARTFPIAHAPPRFRSIRLL
jgi:hypothetical protein